MTRGMGMFRLSVKIDSNKGAIFEYTCMSNTLDSVTSGYPNRDRRELKLRRAARYFDKFRGV